MTERRCENCEFARVSIDDEETLQPFTWLWSKLTGRREPFIKCWQTEALECVRFTPKFFGAYVSPDDWCGEFKPRAHNPQPGGLAP